MGTKVNSNYEDLLTFTRASKGHALRPVSYGDELVTNGDFSTDSDWTKGTGWSISGGTASSDGTQTANANLDQTISTTSGSIYYVTFDLTRGSGGLTGSFAGHGSSGQKTASGSYGFVTIADSSSEILRFVATSSFTGSIDNVSVKEVTFDESDGTLTLFEHPNNVPRVEYDADGNRLGLLIEEARTNLVTHSHLDGANPTGWTTFNLGGTRTATTLYGLPAIRFQATGERPLLQLPLTLSASTTYTMSCYIENAGGTSEEVLELNGFGGVVGDDFIRANDGDSKGYASVTFTTGTDASGFLRLGLGVGSSATGDVTITAIQIEQASFGTSYIKTTGVTATRSADVASLPVSDFGYNQSEGTVVINFAVDNTTSNKRLFSLNDGGTAERIDGLINSANSAVLFAVDGNSNVVNQSIAGYVDGEYSKVAASYELNNYRITLDGATPVSDTSATVPTITTLTIGTGPASAPINGHIKSIKYYPRALTAAQLQEITS